MSLLALGLNHKTAPVEVRERVAFPDDLINTSLQDLRTLSGVKEAAIVSTCNRTEIYCGIESLPTKTLIDWFHTWHGAKNNEYTPYLFTHLNRDAVKHLLRVSCGLDSLILGEPQILGQIKNAFRVAHQNGAVGKELDKLFSYAFSVAKEVRTDTRIGSSPISVAFAAVTLAKQIFGELTHKTALMIGAGETSELVVRHLHTNDIGSIIIANRRAERAIELANQYEGAVGTGLSGLTAILHQADIVISSTASPLPILGKGAVEQALKQRKHRPIFMVDIAIPRDIEPQVGKLNDVYLYTVDDLQEVIKDGQRSREEAANQAEEIIDAKTDEFMLWLRSLNAVDTIKAFRNQAGMIQQKVLTQALLALENGQPPQQVVTQLAHSLTNKLLNTPTQQLRHAGAQSRHELIHAAQELFDLDLKDK
ncbi:MAG: glutamyl-tRNA reductase [Gammaproteobacteria bacterium]|nr:glutamyl-tRNA reductase [Gammaproteobacteria bacterium]